MKSPSSQRVATTDRRRLLKGWVIATIGLAAVIAVAAPVSGWFRDGMAWVAWSVPLVMFVLMAAAIAWLVSLSASRPKRAPDPDASFDTADGVPGRAPRH